MTENNTKITMAFGDQTIDLTSTLGQEIKKCDNQVDQKLKRFIENIEKLEEEKKEIQNQIADAYNEAKAFGFNTKAMKEIIKKRKMEFDERAELEQLIEVYKESLGMPV